MPSLLRNTFRYSCYGWLAIGAGTCFATTPSVTGQSGYINMPSAWVEQDGTISTGYSYDRPYGNLWISTTALPFLQVTGRYVSIQGIPGFSSRQGDYGTAYGRYKDKVFDAKLRLWDETSSMPSLAVGMTDLLGTTLFRGHYMVMSKSFGAMHNLEASLGFGGRRPDGVFAGVRWAPLSAPQWAVVAEYDGNDYSKDYRADVTAAGERRKGPVLGVEYRWGWLGAQVARHRDHFSANAYVSIPFNEREFIPKLLEPKYVTAKDVPQRVSIEAWRSDGASERALVEALVRQNFRNVRVVLDQHTLKLTLTNNRISNLGRAIGRAARTALAFAPQDVRAIHITYTTREQPLVTYEFFDLAQLSDYLSGLSDRETFLNTVLVRYANSGDRIEADSVQMLSGLQDSPSLRIEAGRDGDLVQLRSEDREASRFRVVPKTSFFFNDPSGALRYEIAAVSSYDKRLAEGLYLNGNLKLNLLENVSEVTQQSNSLLPHVRSDVAEYKRGGRFKLNRLLVNKYTMLDERLYARASAGFYEEMYRGLGGQMLYLPKDSRWAADISVDALQQRGYKGWFDKRDYSTVTAMGALHYRLPYDITATARAGRFLARDEGVRLEFKRRFRSGVEFGAWYTKTNGRDITNPGTPSNPYNDKGIFLSVPLNIILPTDSQANATMALAPWTRDVGQMVASPGDLYDMVESPRRDLTTYDGLGNFAERPDEQRLPAVNPPVRPMTNPWPEFRWRLEQSVSTTPTLPQWGKATAAAGGAILAGALLDKPVDRFMKNHAGSRILHAWDNVGKGMPIVLAGTAAGAVALGDDRSRNIGIISLESVASAAVMSMVTKQLVGRARPREELGQFSRTADRSNASFPSNHSAAAFAAVTPFAQEYDAPWLYGLAAAGSLGRTAQRHHWVSDVVAGSVLGYGIGTWLWQAQRDISKSGFAVVPGAKSISMTLSGSY